MQCCALVCVHDDNAYLESALRSVAGIPLLVFVSRTDWAGRAGDWGRSVDIAKGLGAEVGEWGSEAAHRARSMERALEAGFTHAVLLDSDEVVEPALLASLLKVAEAGMAERVHVEWDTYWKDAEHAIRPRERFTPCLMGALRALRYIRLREFEGGRVLFLNEGYGSCIT